jgi:hypothetical protein
MRIIAGGYKPAAARFVAALGNFGAPYWKARLTQRGPACS